MPNYVLYWIWPSKNRRCWQTLLQLHMVALWLPLLFKREGRRVLTLIQTGSAARLWSSKLSPLQRGKETFNKDWLVPSAGSPSIHHFFSVRAVILHLSTSSCPVFLLLTQSCPIFQLTPSPTHFQPGESLLCFLLPASMLSWRGKIIKKGDNYFFSGDWRLQPCSQLYVGSEIIRISEVTRAIAVWQQMKLSISGTTATNFISLYQMRALLTDPYRH